MEFRERMRAKMAANRLRQASLALELAVKELTYSEDAELLSLSELITGHTSQIKLLQDLATDLTK